MSDKVDYGGPERKYKRRRSRGWLALVGAVVLLVLLAGVALLGLSSSSGADEIPRGVQAGGIDLGGKSTEEAERILQERAYALNEIRVSGDGEEITIPASSLGVRPNVEATVQNAREVGREGNVFERASERAGGIFGTVEVPLEVAYDDEQVRAQTESIAQQLNTEPTQAEVAVAADDVEVSPSAEGYEVNVQRTAANIRGAIENLESEAELAGGTTEPEITTQEAEEAAESARSAIAEPVTLTADGEEWQLAPDQLAEIVSVEPRDGEPRVQVDADAMRSELSEVYDSVEAEVQEADFRFAGDRVEVVPGQIGQRIESQKLLSKLQSSLPEGQRQYKVPIVQDKPELTTQEARQQRPTQVIGEYRTTFQTPGSNKPERVENLRTAGAALTGETVAPGDVFSTNDILVGIDYNETSTFIDGAEEDALGGGLCQVASTLYMAANYAGLEPVERHPHYALLNYIRPGFDATLWFGAENGYSGQELDMKFKNTSDGYVMIREYVRGGYLYAEVWGQPTGLEVTMDSNNLVENEEIARWRTTKTVTDAEGETVFSGEFHTDTYYALETEDQGELPPNKVDVAPVNP
jgi:vancomycin resistance protein YoaR